ncbi:uncharacterized protein LOC129756669 [Uranotaenia lowii]|uniref:uncharacterized protein LOC129756669 n=1 Tax=Uranotaenia lowii TaxID=190385 RepID=UPI00247AA6B0|nr:uncharacterized protein LOC129756669 [Uranotaenia lowii]
MVRDNRRSNQDNTSLATAAKLAKLEAMPNLTMWQALVEVASLCYEELIAQETKPKPQKLANKTLDSDADSTFDQSTIIEANSTTYEEDKENCALVIDESATRPSVIIREIKKESAVAGPSGILRESKQMPVAGPSKVNKEANNSFTAKNLPPMPMTSSGTRTGAKPKTSKSARTAAKQQPKLNQTIPGDGSPVYNRNMARVFPGSENRTPEQQAVREKNTLAARQSRAKMREMDRQLQEESSEEEMVNRFLKDRLAVCFVYANQMRKKLNMGQVDFLDKFEASKQDYEVKPVQLSDISWPLKDIKYELHEQAKVQQQEMMQWHLQRVLTAAEDNITPGGSPATMDGESASEGNVQTSPSSVETESAPEAEAEVEIESEDYYEQ